MHFVINAVETMYIYELTVHPTLQYVKAMTTHIKWVASSTHDFPVQLRLPFKASKHALKGAFKWLETLMWAGAAAYCCTNTAWDYPVGWKSQRRGVDSLGPGARPRHWISSWSTLVHQAGFQSEFRIQQQMWSSTLH